MKAELISVSDQVMIFNDPIAISLQKGNWHKLFGNKNPIVLEVGMGTGGFLQQLIADDLANQRKFNYIGLEVKEVRVTKANRKNKEYIEKGILKLINGKAQRLDEFFGSGEISRIHLNFSDPWPKDRHHGRRLTAPEYLEMYKKILAKNGELVIKTDNEELFRYTQETLPPAGFKIIEQSEDLHKSDYPLKNYLTEFETRFLAKGLPIYYIKALI